MRGNVFQDKNGNYITESELKTIWLKELQQENQQLKDRDLIVAMELEKLQDENQRLKKAIDGLSQENTELRIQVSSREEVAGKLQKKLDKIIEHVIDCCYYPCIDTQIDKETYSNMTDSEVMELIKIIEEKDENIK